MLTAGLAPLDETITIAELTRDPYPIYRRLRREAPVLRVKSVGRTFLTKAADTKYVKDNAAVFSSDDPNTPMKRAFLAHTLMRKDHDEHRTETHGNEAGSDAEDDRIRLGAAVCETGRDISRPAAAG
jgi:cytochrome P450